MRKKILGLASVLLLAIVLPAAADSTVKCESVDGKYRECGVGAASDIRVLRQLSKTNCARGQTWGYLNGKIWVDEGCRAEFVVENLYPASNRNNNEQILVCESVNGRRKHCAIDTSGGVRMTRRLSDSSCDFKNDWDYDDHGVWVRHGCRAEFAVKMRPVAYTPQISSMRVASDLVTCESKNGRRQHCKANTMNGVALHRQLSDSSCVLNSTWGFDSKGIWVRSGCRAEFILNP